MLSNEKLVSALSEYLEIHGIGNILSTIKQLPLYHAGSPPTYLFNPTGANRLRSPKTRLSSRKSSADKYLRHLEEEGIHNVQITANVDIPPINNPHNQEILLSFLRKYFDHPNLQCKSVLTITAINDDNLYTRFPYAYRNHDIVLGIRCLLPNPSGTTPISVSEASIKFSAATHTIIGPQYVTYSDIVIRLPEDDSPLGSQIEESIHCHNTCKKVKGTFLYKFESCLSNEDKDALTAGSAHMLLSIDSEVRTLSAELLYSLFADDKSYSYKATQEHILKSLTCLVAEGGLEYTDIKITSDRLHCNTNPNDSNKIEIRHACVASASYGKHFKNVEIEMEFIAEVQNIPKHNTEATYSVPRYSFKLSSKNESFLQAVTGASKPVPSLTFADNERAISHAFLGNVFIDRLKKYLEEKIQEKTFTQDSRLNPQEKSANSTQYKEDSNLSEKQKPSEPKEKASLLWRILGIPGNICRLAYSAICITLKAILSPFCSIARKIGSVFGYKSDSKDATKSLYDVASSATPSKDNAHASPSQTQQSTTNQASDRTHVGNMSGGAPVNPSAPSNLSTVQITTYQLQNQQEPPL